MGQANDDLFERRRNQQRRRSIARTPRKQGRRSASLARESSRRRTPKKNYSATALKGIYEKVMTLAAKNKINSKNAWDLDFTANIFGMLGLNREQKNVSFEKAALILDASSRIYSCRVDGLHNDTFRVLNNISGKQEVVSDLVKKKKRRIYKSNKDTLGKDRDLTAKLDNIICFRDCMQSKISSHFSSSDVKGLLFSNL